MNSVTTPLLGGIPNNTDRKSNVHIVSTALAIILFFSALVNVAQYQYGATVSAARTPLGDGREDPHNLPGQRPDGLKNPFVTREDRTHEMCHSDAYDARGAVNPQGPLLYIGINGLRGPVNECKDKPWLKQELCGYAKPREACNFIKCQDAPWSNECGFTKYRTFYCKGRNELGSMSVIDYSPFHEDYSLEACMKKCMDSPECTAFDFKKTHSQRGICYLSTTCTKELAVHDKDATFYTSGPNKGVLKNTGGSPLILFVKKTPEEIKKSQENPVIAKERERAAAAEAAKEDPGQMLPIDDKHGGTCDMRALCKAYLGDANTTKQN